MTVNISPLFPIPNRSLKIMGSSKVVNSKYFLLGDEMIDKLQNYLTYYHYSVEKYI